MRRILASLALRAATVAASVALLCFLALHSVADPTRPARIADAVLASSAGQATLTAALTDTTRRLVPGIDEQSARRVAAAAVTDPRLAGMVHAAARGDGNVQLGSVLHDAAGRVDPALAAHLPARGVSVPLPGRGLTWLVPLRATLSTVAGRLAPLAAAAFAFALLVAPRRSRVLRRGGRWCLTASLAGVLLFVAGPHLLLSSGLGNWAATVAVALQAAGSGVTGPLVALLVAGIGLLLAAAAARAFGPIARPHRGPRDRPGSVPLDIPRPGDRPGQATTAASGR